MSKFLNFWLPDLWKKFWISKYEGRAGSLNFNTKFIPNHSAAVSPYILGSIGLMISYNLLIFVQKYVQRGFCNIWCDKWLIIIIVKWIIFIFIDCSKLASINAFESNG